MIQQTATVGHVDLLRKWKSWQRLCFASQATAPICLMSPRKFDITDKVFSLRSLMIAQGF